MEVIRAQAGRVVPIRFTTRKVRDDATNGQRERVNGCRVTIKNPSGTIIVNAGVAKYIRRGQLIYYWDTTGLAVGDYLVEGRFGAGFDSVANAVQNRIQRNVILRLVTTL